MSQDKRGRASQHLPANSKHSQAHGDVPLSVIFLQDLSVKRAFPYDWSQPVRGGDDFHTSPIGHTKAGIKYDSMVQQSKTDTSHHVKSQRTATCWVSLNGSSDGHPMADVNPEMALTRYQSAN